MAKAPPKQPASQPITPLTNQLDGSPAIFAVLAAANAAGYDAQVNAVSNSPVRKAVREYLAKQNLQSLGPLERFLRDHRPKDPSAELGQYISFALFSTGAPDFKPLRSDIPMPPDTAGLEELPPLLAAFYAVRPAWASCGSRCSRITNRRSPDTPKVSPARCSKLNAYFRNEGRGYLGHRFQIYIDLLGAPNQVQTRNYVDDYYVVVTPAAEPPIDEIRHAYLHYLADPVGLKYSDDLKKKRALGEYALGSPILAQNFRDDFVQLATESFIKAVESRLPPRNPMLAEEAMREGYVLAPAFADQLALYEKQEHTLVFYFPDTDRGHRLESARRSAWSMSPSFVSALPTRLVRPATVTTTPVVATTGPAKTLEDADHASYTDKDYARAKTLYLRLLEETDQNSMHARAYYGLARIAVLERDPETGDRLFRKVLELEPDVTTKSWSLLYLGRLADSQGDREQALEHYKAALAVPEVPDEVREAAEQGLKEPPTKK